MEAETKSHLSDRGTWMRLLYMIFFMAIFGVAQMVAAAVVLAQFLFKLLTGQPNPRLREFGGSVAAYFQQTAAFLTYHSEEMPFPFGEWPVVAAGASPPPPAPAKASPPPAASPPAPAKPSPTPAPAAKAEAPKPAPAKTAASKTAAPKTAAAKKPRKPVAKPAPKAKAEKADEDKPAG